MILPKQNISIMDVRNCIGYPSMDLGTLCSCGEKYINKWSKYKPVHNVFTTERPSDWWKGTLRNCGIEYLQHNTITNLLSSIDSGEEQFPYLGPRGGTGSPYRLGDFAGYNSTITAPIFAGNHEGTYYKNNVNLGVGAIVRNAGVDELSVADVFGNAFDGMYYAAALKTGNNSPLWLTASNPITANDSFINIPMSYLNANTTYYLYQFLSSYKKPSITTAEQAGHFVAIPGTQKQAIKIESSDISIAIRNVEYNLGRVTGEIYINNSNGHTQNLMNVAVYFVYANTAPNDPLEVGETFINLDNIYITGGQILTVPFESGRNVLPEFQQRGGKIFLYFNNKLQAQTMIPMMAPD